MIFSFLTSVQTFCPADGLAGRLHAHAVRLIILFLFSLSLIFGESIPARADSSGIAEWSRIRIAAVATSEFIAGRSEGEVYTQISSTLSAANVYYQPLRIQFEIAGVQYLQDPSSDPYSDRNGTLTPLSFLSVARREWAERAVPEHQAVVVFASRVFGEVKGLSYTATSCTAPLYSTIFVTSAGDSPAARTGLISTLAHELGHFVGMEHDQLNYPDVGPSLMAPQSVVNPFGFSAVSIAQFQAHAGPGKPGSACFESYVPAPDAVTGGGDPGITSGEPLQFVGGSVQTVEVSEGGRMSKTFTTFGARGVTLAAAQLPAGAAFDELTGTLTYEPGYDLATARRPAVVVARIVARSFASSAEVKLSIVVRNKNRAPVISLNPVSGRSSFYQVEAGSRLRLVINAVDLDGGQPRIAAVNSAALKSYPGRPKLTARSGRMTLDWTVPSSARGNFPFTIVASDREKGITAESFTVSVTAPNLPPVITAPAAFTVSAGGNSFDVSASDPDGRPVDISIAGLPAGAAITSSGGLKHVSILPGAELQPGATATVTASDGAKTSQFKISLKQESSVSTFVGSTAGPDFLRLFSQQDGSINRYGCSGDLISSTKTPAGPSAQYLSRRIGQIEYSAVFFVREGAGIWSVTQYDTAGDPATVIETQWGLAGDTAAFGDFDGDGKFDLAVVRREGWFIRFGNGSTQELSGLSDETGVSVPFAGDLDGDKKDERIVFFRSRSGAAVFRADFADGRTADYLAAQPDISQTVAPAVSDLNGDGADDLIVRFQSGSISVLSPAHLAFGSAIVDSRAARLNFDGCPGGVAGKMAEQDSLRSPRLISAAVSALRSALRRSGPAFGDLNGDRKFDLSVIRTDSKLKLSQWYSNIAGGPQIGQAVDLAYAYPVAGSFFGNGRSQLGLFSAGRWVITGNDGEQRESVWGVSGDLPVPADYNGDGVTDLAVYRPADGSWWIEYLGTDQPVFPARVFNLGTSGDIPVPADFDGDGAADIAIYRPEAGMWFVSLSSRRETASVLFGTRFDIPVAGDFDGSGAADFALFRPSGASWSVLTSNGPESFAWGLAGDLPVIADFNGDGASDIAVFRNGTGEWFVHPDGGGKVDAFQFGLPGDLPIGALRPERIL